MIISWSTIVSFPAILGTSGRRFNSFTRSGDDPAFIFKTPMNPVRKSPERLGTRLGPTANNDYVMINIDSHVIIMVQALTVPLSPTEISDFWNKRYV